MKKSLRRADSTQKTNAGQIAFDAMMYHMKKCNISWEKAVEQITNLYKNETKSDADTQAVLASLQSYALHKNLSLEDTLKHLMSYKEMIQDIRDFADENHLTYDKVVANIGKHLRNIDILKQYVFKNKLSVAKLQQKLSYYVVLVKMIESYAKKHWNSNLNKAILSLEVAAHLQHSTKARQQSLSEV